MPSRSLTALVLLLGLQAACGRGDPPSNLPPSEFSVERVEREQFLPRSTISDVTLREMNRNDSLDTRQKVVQSLLSMDAKSWTEADFKRFLEDVLRRPGLWAELGLGNVFLVEEFWEDRADPEGATILIEDLHREALEDGSVRWSARMRLASDSQRRSQGISFHRGVLGALYYGPPKFSH